MTAKEVFENRTMFTHPETQKCFEWVPSLTGKDAWNPDSIQICDLQDPVNGVQGPASTKTMGIIYTCNKLKCVVHCPCSVCNDKKKTCTFLCRDKLCCECSSQCLKHQIKLPRLFNSETDLFTLVTNKLDCYRFAIPYAGIPASCPQCSQEVLEHQTFHLVFHSRCRYCRNDLRPFERKNIVTMEDYQEAEKILKWLDSRTCSYCLVKCKNKVERKKHEATVHENKGKYKCESCDKTYSNKNALNYHISNKHSSRDEEEKFCCELCQSEFTTDASLRRHIDTVHQDLSQRSMFECEECGNKFAQKGHLNRHRKEKHYDFNANLDFVEDMESFLQNKCDQCDKSFKRKYQLQRHIKTVHCDVEVKKQFKCSKCESKFSRPDALRRHVKQKHTD